MSVLVAWYHCPDAFHETCYLPSYREMACMECTARNLLNHFLIHRQVWTA